MRNKNLFIVIGMVAGVLALGILAIAALVYVGLTGISSRPATAEEKALLVNVGDLAAYCEIPGDRSLCESWIAKWNLDGSQELEYDYDTNKDTAAMGFLFLTSEAEISANPRLAKESFYALVVAYKVGAGLVKGRELRENAALFSLGEDNYAAIVMQNGKPVGNAIATRRGRVVYSLLVYGVYFDDRAVLEELIGPKMRQEVP